jgi:hypothetical protein
MTTLAANKPRTYEGSIRRRNTLPVIAADILYEGSAIGQVTASGHVRPLTSADVFVGFAEQQVDNSLGAAAARNVDLITRGAVQLPITGLVITDRVGLPVYATDDDTFSLSPVGGVFIGFLDRYVSAGVGIVDFYAGRYRDPFAGWKHELKSANYTLDAEDAGKFIWVDTDATVLTLPAVGGIASFRIGNIAAYGVSGLAISPNAADMIEGPDITAADNKDIINTKATAARGDWVQVNDGDANGWSISQMVGTWAREA